VRTLHLLRHAKSSWDDPAVPDAERPLAPRGRKAVAALLQHLAALELSADLVLVSPARRARATWDGVAAGVGGPPTVREEPRIYEATLDDLLAIVRAVPDSVSSLLLVGHNPGFEQLATTLTGTGDDSALASLRAGYPTGGFASLTFAESWNRVRTGGGHLIRFVRPRELAN
jgi:phosphohistidine phosphatase